VGVPNAYCYKATVDGRDQTGVFLGNADPKFMGESGGHAMNIVGYNDGWLYRNRFQFPQVSSQHKGGFILHNSWRAGGHSVEYLYGSQSEENEAIICPNHVSPLNWIPATYECVAQAVANGTLTNTSLPCSADLERVRGKNRTKGADLLRCQSAACNASRPLWYVLERVSGYEGQINPKFTASGLADVTFLTIDHSDPANYQVGRATIKSLPFHSLSSYFAPLTLVPNDPENCGYWMMPYDTLNNMVRINWDLLDNFRVVDLEIEFTGTSYALHPNTTAPVAAFLRNATRTRHRPKFDGPLPFDLIYK
jgi:hypothetical protein